MPADDPKPPAGGTPESDVTPAPPKRPPKPPNPLLAMVPSVAVDRLNEVMPGKVGEPHSFAGEVTVDVATENLLEVCGFLRDDGACAFDLLVDISGTDFPEEEKRFRLAYHLASLGKGHRLRLRCHVADGEAAASVTSLWPGADWFEREIFDLLGVEFTGHAHLARILMPDDWVGHPLRKDYPLPGYPEHHLRYRTADVTRRRYIDISWKATGEKAATIVKKYKGRTGAPESAPHVPAEPEPVDEPAGG